jgi:hypothetical protein
LCAFVLLSQGSDTHKFLAVVDKTVIILIGNNIDVMPDTDIRKGLSSLRVYSMPVGFEGLLSIKALVLSVSLLKLLGCNFKVMRLLVRMMTGDH